MAPCTHRDRLLRDIERSHHSQRGSVTSLPVPPSTSAARPPPHPRRTTSATSYPCSYPLSKSVLSLSLWCAPCSPPPPFPHYLCRHWRRCWCARRRVRLPGWLDRRGLQAAPEAALQQQGQARGQTVDSGGEDAREGGPSRPVACRHQSLFAAFSNHTANTDSLPLDFCLNWRVE